MSRFQSSTLVNAAGVPTRRNFHEPSPPYDPNVERRRCSSCGARSSWQRWPGENPGGWYCCTRPDLATDRHDGMTHVCTTACILVGGAA